MRVMLTGGTGFLGAFVAAAFAQRGDEVVILARDPGRTGYLENAGALQSVTLVPLESDYGNLPEVMSQYAPDVVVHLASESRGGENDSDLRRYVEANILYGSLLLNAMRRAGIRALVNCGTSWQSDSSGGYQPFNFYAATKQCMEDILSYYVQDGLRAISLRMFDLLGPFDKRSRVVDLMINAVLSGEPVGMSPGEQKLSLVDVRDAAAAVVTAADRAIARPGGGHDIFGVSSAAPVRLRDVAEVLERVAGRSPPVRWGDLPYRKREIMEPCAAIPCLPDWEPVRSLDESITDMVAARRSTLQNAE